MSKPTPGPWSARMQVSSRGDNLGWIIEHKNGRIVWSSYSMAYPNAGEQSPYPIGGANARLIAAAPDLLAACQDALAAGNDGDWQSAEKVLRAAVSRSLDDAQTGNEQPKGGA
jgi:hypothetical protein